MITHRVGKYINQQVFNMRWDGGIFYCSSDFNPGNAGFWFLCCTQACINRLPSFPSSWPIRLVVVVNDCVYLWGCNILISMYFGVSISALHIIFYGKLLLPEGIIHLSLQLSPPFSVVTISIWSLQMILPYQNLQLFTVVREFPMKKIEISPPPPVPYLPH